ncbi:MAG: LysR family transcriptional regulator [Desulfobacteraceae bacterium]|nr:LysR family transcriptional regulator [Desulfobacteraceae bacterium]MBC2755961.1 LysR family transcriptional regulator [Desulfobacteraceae bacterium]
MDLWHLKVFQKVIDHKGFSNASKVVNLTQPTISSHIKELENYYECRLVDRLGKQALPTKAGELLYDYAGKLLSLFEETETAMAEFLGKISGRLAIGGSTIPGNYILPQEIGHFLKKFEDVNISVIIGDTEQIINDIVDYRLELAIVGAKTELKQIKQKKLIEDEMSLVIPGNHKWAARDHVSIDMLFSEPFITREQGSGTLKSIQNSFAEIGKDVFSLNIIAQLGSTAAVIQGIKNNVGISIFSTRAIKEELAAGSLKALAIKGVDLKRNFYLTTHKNRTASPLCRAFINFLEEKFSG